MSREFIDWKGHKNQVNGKNSKRQIWYDTLENNLKKVSSN